MKDEGEEGGLDVEEAVRKHIQDWKVDLYAQNPHLYSIPDRRVEEEVERYRQELLVERRRNSLWK